MGTETSGPANADLKFLPRLLTYNCRQLIESYHAIHGYTCLPDILWRAEVRDFVEINADLRRMLRKASITRSARKANTSYIVIAGALLSLEVLASDYLGWGTRFPFAKRRAAILLSEHLPAAREFLKDVYLSKRNFVRSQVVKAEISPPPKVAMSYADPVSAPEYDPADEMKVMMASGKSLVERLPPRQGVL
jgi:hypothetical protein